VSCAFDGELLGKEVYFQPVKLVGGLSLPFGIGDPLEVLRPFCI
jgi:hypothetical protein